jgi:Amt family ammonium transporter
VDLAGSATVFLLGTLVAVAAFLLIKPRRPVEDGPAKLPPVHFPLLMVLGALFAVIGWPGLVLGNALLQEQVVLSLVLVNLMLAAAGGALLVLLYTWFVTNWPDALATARGAVAGLVGASAACAFVPAWAALLIGAAGGGLLLLGLYISEQVLRLDDPSGSAATFGLPGVWGILAPAIFADGRWGAGWNGVGGQEYLGIAGQGISGLLVGSGYQAAGAGQLQAQLVGLGALVAVSLLLTLLIFRAGIWVSAAAQRAQAGQPAALPEAASAEAEQTGEEA